MVDSVRFSQSHGILGLVIDGDWNTGFDCDSINMAKYNHCTILIMGDASVAGAAVITLYGGATDGAKTAAATFGYRYASAAVNSAGSDVFGAVATSAALTSTPASIASSVMVIEFDAADLNISGTQYQYATLNVSAAGTAGTVDAVAILSEARYEEAIMDTAK